MNLRWSLLPLILCVACISSEMKVVVETETQKKAKITDTRYYTVHQRISLTNTGEHKPEKQNLWVALIHDIPPYQQVISRTILPNKNILFGDEYGNHYAEFDLSDHPPGETITVEITYEVSVNEIQYDLSNCAGGLLDEFTQPELHIESANPQMISLAENLSKGKQTACAKVRAFYNYAGDELIYSYNRKAWGAQATFGLMGADCTEYASLVAALSRAEGIPARYFEGLLYLEEKNGDENQEIAQIEHAWLDVNLPGIGWTAIDPTLGRWPIYREKYFAHYTPNHIIVTTGRNPVHFTGSKLLVSPLLARKYYNHKYFRSPVGYYSS